MRLLALTKPFGDMGIPELVGELAALGVDGADLMVREGQPVTPSDPRGIVLAARALADHGLGLDVVTTDLVEADRTAGHIMAAAAEAGAGLVRVGFFRYDAQRGYRRCLDEARKGLAGLARLASDHGVTLALQTHHGTIHPSAAHALNLIQGLDDVRVYADPGNQAKEGSENWRLSLDLIGGSPACVGVKNAAWRHGPHGWVCEWQPLADGGVVAWPEMILALRERSYTGPLSLHVHYPTSEPGAALRRDMTHLRGLLGSGPGAPEPRPMGRERVVEP